MGINFHEMTIPEVLDNIKNASVFIANSEMDIPLTQTELVKVKEWETQILSIGRTLTNTELSIFTERQLQFIYDCFGRVADYYRRIANKMSYNSAEVFSNYVMMYEDFCANIHQYLPFTQTNITERDEIYELIREGQRQKNEGDAILSEMREMKVNSQNQQKLVDEMIATTKEDLREVLVAKFGSLYDQKAGKHQTAAYWWLGCIGLLLATTIKISSDLLDNIDKDTTKYTELLDHPGAVILYLGVRLVIISTLFVGITIAIKNYRANKHNEILNRHRQLSLNTFETFINSTDKDAKATKEAILIQVTQTIFSHQNTGFAPSDNEVESPAKVLEFLKSSKALPQ